MFLCDAGAPAGRQSLGVVKAGEGGCATTKTRRRRHQLGASLISGPIYHRHKKKDGCKNRCRSRKKRFSIQVIIIFSIYFTLFYLFVDFAI